MISRYIRISALAGIVLQLYVGCAHRRAALEAGRPAGSMIIAALNVRVSFSGTCSASAALGEICERAGVSWTIRLDNPNSWKGFLTAPRAWTFADVPASTAIQDLLKDHGLAAFATPRSLIVVSGVSTIGEGSRYSITEGIWLVPPSQSVSK